VARVARWCWSAPIPAVPWSSFTPTQENT
jgi:hypothetical protein